MQMQSAKTVTGFKLYVMMGHELRAIEEVSAGNVVAIAGLQAHVLKFATLSSTRNCVSLAHITFQVDNFLIFIGSLHIFTKSLGRSYYACGD